MTVSPVCGVSGLICFTPSDLHQMMYHTSNFRDLHLLFQQFEAFPQTVLWHTWSNLLDHLSPDPSSTFHPWSVPPLKLILYFLPTRFLQVGFVRIHPCCFSQQSGNIKPSMSKRFRMNAHPDGAVLVKITKHPQKTHALSHNHIMFTKANYFQRRPTYICI